MLPALIGAAIELVVVSVFLSTGTLDVAGLVMATLGAILLSLARLDRLTTQFEWMKGFRFDIKRQQEQVPKKVGKRIKESNNDSE
jgi:hypothetical protein